MSLIGRVEEECFFFYGLLVVLFLLQPLRAEYETFLQQGFLSLYLFCASIIIRFSFIHDFPSSGRYNTHTHAFFSLNTAVVYYERWYVLVFRFFAI